MSAYYIGTVLDAACILMYAGLGDAVLLACGEVNLGGDGQIYASSLAVALVLCYANSLPPALCVFAALICGAAAALAIAFLCLLLRAFKVNILLSTYLISAALTPIADYLIAQKYRGEGNLTALPFISGSLASPRILPPSTLSLASAAAPLLCLAVYQYMKRSEGGKRLVITGISPAFADYAGLGARKVVRGALAFCLAMHALAAFALVTGTHRTCLSGMQAGLGWSALTVSLLARGNALLVVLYSLVLQLLMTVSNSIALTHFVPFDASALIAGAAIAFAAIAAALKERKKKEADDNG